MSDDHRPDPDQPEPDQPEPDRPEIDALEAADAATEADEATRAAASDTFEQAADGLIGNTAAELEPAEEPAAEPEPAGKLERLQKILAQAGIASRRHAEELITEGRVQVNGKVVTELGTKADPARDHIRVDGKLLQGSERLRYFMLNKPKGFVTTVSDPEGRPTIMQFFSKLRERLYPVGRLDYLSEGLLLVTNDGELANKLTRAASGVEKTYLVKVSGHPTEEEIERLREGVSIDRVKPGSGRVHTAPAQIRKVRHGDNPWYEVVIIEGRNRELRKMFEEIGHHVEKIRRVGYGPLVLDLEPGKLRELESEEVEDLRKAAEGTYRKPKARDARKRSAAAEAQLPTVRPRWNPKRGGEGRQDRGPSRRPERRSESGPARGPNRGPERGQFRTPPRGEFRPAARFGEGRPQQPPRRDASDRPVGGAPERPRRFAEGQPRERGNSPAWNKKPEHGQRPPRFDRNATADRSGARPDRFRSNDRRAPGAFRPEFRSKSVDERGPKPFTAKRPGPAEGGLPGKRKLEIRPADERFGGTEPGAPERQDRRPFQPRGGARPGRGPSTGRFADKDRGRPQFGRESAQGSSRTRPFDRDRLERPRFDRPKPGGVGKTRSEFRPQRSDRPNPEARPGGTRHPGGGSGRAYGARPGGTRPGGGLIRKPGGKPGGKPGRMPGGSRPSTRPSGRRPGGKPGGKKRS
jgi:23S rRNA pseudouridine2605 synthase